MLKVSEIFYGLQGEGPSIGIPAVFVRLAGCNLKCVWCDSVKLWTKGDDYSESDLAKKVIELAGGRERLVNYQVHVVITGGEPTLHIPNLSTFLDTLFAEVGWDPTRPQRPVFVEMETNGAIEAGRFIKKYITQVNCSPKLANSGEPLEKRFKPEALKQIMANGVCVFKFVVASPDDWKEIEDTYVPIIGRDFIYLMPKANNREELLKNSPFVWDLCCKEGLAMTTRLHQICWDVETGK